MRDHSSRDHRPIVVWLRNDLRLDDNPALAAAADSGRPVIPLVVLDEASDGFRPLGGAHKWWLHHSLEALGEACQKLGSGLVLRRGPSAEIVPALVKETGAVALHCNRRYEQAAAAIDDEIKQELGDVAVECFSANLLHDPDRLLTKTGGFYKVYTPFWKNLSGRGDPRQPITAPKTLKGPEGGPPQSDALEAWALLPKKPDWSGGMAATWIPGEAAAQERFAHFCEALLDDYDNGRQRPAEDATSRMSPHLRFGEVSPFRLWHLAEAAASRRRVPEKAIETFKKELAWRDFNYHLLYHFGALDSADFNRRFSRFPWRRSAEDLGAWQKGLTGYPIVDAAMRQLWQIGWMHNRMRMIVGSFLTKDLLIDWREGERWFWNTLVDADSASNTSQWQWIAGSGADAQPFFRIFNPVKQGQTFDGKGAYIRRYVPELAKLSDKDIHTPWLVSAPALAKANVRLGETYPRPIVDHDRARERALDAYRSLRD